MEDISRDSVAIKGILLFKTYYAYKIYILDDIDKIVKKTQLTKIKGTKKGTLGIILSVK